MRIIRRIPTEADRNNAAWRSLNKWTRELLRELGRLGYDVTGEVDDHTYLTNVGRAAMTLVLRADLTTGDIQRVSYGQHSWTARQATLALRRKAARSRKVEG